MRTAAFIAIATALLSQPVWGEVDYNFDVKPILSDRCFHCHGPDEENRKGKLRLDTPEGSREVIASGELLARLTSDDPDERMPPPGSHLSISEEEVATLRAWIDAGSDYKKHWSFIPLAEIPVPGEGNPIDAFVSAQLRAEELERQPEAGKEQLVRRVAFDLTGLPPTLAEIDAFLADTSPDAYGKMVDRFLAKPAFGERMAAHWMDVARYSDTYGYQVDRDRFVWPWRDWVIRAFNDNKPFDEFILEQLAGDMLPDATDQQILATAFNRLHPQKVEGGSTPEEFRVEYVADRVNTFGTAFLGLTLECTRCHDHKYDPISQREYFQLFSYFQNVDEAGLYSYFTPAVPTPTLRLTSSEQKKRAAELRAKVAEAERAIAAVSGIEQRHDAWIKGEPKPKPQIGGEILHLDFEGDPGGRNSSVPGKAGKAIKLTGDDPVGTKVGNFRRYQPFSVSLWMQTPDVKDRAVVFHRSRAWTDSGSRGYQLLIEDGKLSWSLIHFWPGNAMRVRTTEPIPIGKWLHVVVSNDGSSKASGLRIHINGREAECDVVRDNLYKGITGGGGDHIAIGERFRDRGFKGGLVDEFRVFDRELTAGEVAHVFSGADLQSDRDYYTARVDPEAAAAHAALLAARTELANFEDGLQEIMVMREQPEPKPAFLLERGAYDLRGDPVTAGTPDALPAGAGASDRLGLAHWLTSPEQPLTARVTVNRFWQMLFGEGLVRTPEDFGSQGALPTHPELLDWLAKHFVDSGWDVKALFKLMVRSATYRQGSHAPPELVERDPANQLLARAPQHRLPAEMIRDQWLATSGLLVPKVGGPSVKPYELTESFKPLGRDKGEGLYRRSLYTFWKRTAPAPVMMSLDASKRDVCTVRRERTSTPLQALVMLNDPQLNEAARVFGAKMLKKHGAAGQPMYEEMFRMTTGRKPTARELELLAALYTEQRSVFAAKPQDAEKYLATGDAKPDPAIAPEDAAAASVLASAMLNLWESVARQ